MGPAKANTPSINQKKITLPSVSKNAAALPDASDKKKVDETNQVFEGTLFLLKVELNSLS